LVETDSVTPQQIEQHLNSKFSKYKIVELRAVRGIENDMEFYQVQVKSKSIGLVTEWYDRSLVPIDNFRGIVSNEYYSLIKELRKFIIRKTMDFILSINHGNSPFYRIFYRNYKNITDIIAYFKIIKLFNYEY